MAVPVVAARLDVSDVVFDVFQDAEWSGVRQPDSSSLLTKISKFLTTFEFKNFISIYIYKNFNVVYLNILGYRFSV